MKPVSLVAALVFSLVAIAHLLRLIFQTEVLVEGTVVPLGVSIVGFIIPAALAVGLWREAKSAPPAL